MRFDIDDFKAQVDSNFWKHITQDTYFKDIINYKDISKDKFLANLGNEINSYNHNFEKPMYYFVPKSQGILRKVKIYSISDSCVYYYCVKKLQNELSDKIKQNKSVFGGFKFTQDLKISDDDIGKLFDMPAYGSSLALNSFRKEWSEYQRLAKKLFDRKFDIYLHLDIAHFYDDINLDILENDVRNIIQEKSDIISILFHFLRFSDKRDLGYDPSSVGIPQEEVGEMSRMLANFYLHRFDNNIIRWLKEIFGDNEENHKYLRYADDMWFCFNGDKNKAYQIIQKISLELDKIKLHINEGKILILDANGFSDHWLFDEWDELFELKGRKNNLKPLIKLFYKIYENKGNNRWFSVLIYIFKMIFSNSENLEEIKNDFNLREIIFILIDNPKLIYKFTEKYKDFFQKSIKIFPDIKKEFIEIIKKNDILYPDVEYFILEILATVSNDEEIFNLFYCYFFKKTKKDFQWYSKCICIRYFIDNIDFIENFERQKLTKLVLHLGNSTSRQNKLTRRYSIRFLAKLRDGKGNEVLKNYFNEPNDLTFLEFLRNS